MVRLELLYSVRDAREFTIIEAEQALLRDVPVAASAQQAAIGALRDLASDGPGQHRVPLADALIATAAQDAGVDVLLFIDPSWDHQPTVSHGARTDPRHRGDPALRSDSTSKALQHFSQRLPQSLHPYSTV